jgi:predicted RecB family nuclease
MDLREDKPRFYATDLTNFIGCRHLTVLERLAAHKRAKRPYFDDPMLEILRERGLAHEQEYVRRLARSGKSVVEITRSSSQAFDETLTAMREGADVVVQARLEHGAWAGWADVLLRVDGESRFGSWRYEPVETKLAKTTRGTTLIQLCLYADLLAALQGASPEILRVVVPETKFKPECYRFDEFGSYYRLVRRNFEAEMERPLPSSAELAEPYPDPVSHCDMCNWYGLCDTRWRRDDHISLVAGIQKTQRKELASWGVTTLAALADVPIPLPHVPSRGSAAALGRVREQARLQFEARAKGRPVYELLPIERDQGLAALPPPSPLDIFLDLEGDRQAEHGGLDYLFGYALRDADGGANYEALWAMSPVEEKSAFERLIDFIVERRHRDPGMHVFHYAAYEPTSMKRLMGRYGTRADELDELLRAGVFVDLYSVVRKALRAGIESYSIKRLEPFYGLAREVDLRKASRHLRAVEYAIAKREAECLTTEIREAVRSYNRDDCLSALELRDWLERLRLEAEEKRGERVPRPTPPLAKPEEKLDERLARIRAVSDALTADLPLERSRVQEAQWVLAQLLEWHRREDKVDWWEFFRLNQMTDAELLEEPSGIAGLAYDRRLETTKRGVVVDRYQFPPQDTELDERDDAFAPGSEKASSVAKVEAIDLEHRTIDLRKGVARADLHPTALFTHERVSNPEAVGALLRLGEFVRDHGIDAPGRYRAPRDLLLCRNPRLVPDAALRQPAEGTVACARRVALALDCGVLAIQGPPGAGKTFTAARMIIDLIRAGKKVGVTAVSHKVIRNLLEEVVRAAAAEAAPVRCMHRVSEKSKPQRPGIEEETDAGKAVAKIRAAAYDVVGGTAWVWPKEELAEAIDVLFVDEAGQMSLANVLACAQAAKNLVLLGDPQQLEQPQKASHPIGSELSALEYLLEGHETMPEERGLFLGETWRLHPLICGYTSELFYEGKLQPHPGLAGQAIAGPTTYAGAGLFYVPVAHDGNQNSSTEEAERVAEVVKSLLVPGVTWVNRHGEAKSLTLTDLLIVAPYNAQVSEIAERIPGARVGTVDKFQGQEAPVVIYSMATSSPEEAPHGMEFLFSRHRLNVATSRARCVCVLVGNPELFEPECRTPEQMRMANAFCRYLELARVVQPTHPSWEVGS